MSAPTQTTVKFHLTHPSPGGRLTPGSWWFTPSPGPTSATTRLAPKAFPVRPTAEEAEQGWFLLDLFATDDPAWSAPWCWKVREPYPGAIRYLAVPCSEDAIDYAALADVDPMNLPALGASTVTTFMEPAPTPVGDGNDLPSPGLIGGYVDGLL